MLVDGPGTRKWGAKGMNRTSTKGNEICLPQEIKDAVLQGYDVYITREVKEGIVSAKITFHKVHVAGRERIATQEKH